MADVRVLIVTDDTLARAGLGALLAHQPGCEVTGLAAGSDDLSALVAVHRPEAILWDFGWNAADAVARAALFVSRSEPSGPAIPILALVPDSAAASAAWAAGVRALLPREATPGQITAALGALVAGLAAIDPTLIEAIVDRTLEAPGGWSEEADTRPVEELTARELQVLRLLAEGLPNKTIATRLEVSEHTVKFHVNAILGKLGAAGRTEAVVRATRLGLIHL